MVTRTPDNMQSRHTNNDVICISSWKQLFSLPSCMTCYIKSLGKWRYMHAKQSLCKVFACEVLQYMYLEINNRVARKLDAGTHDQASRLSHTKCFDLVYMYALVMCNMLIMWLLVRTSHKNV